jgi:amino-acid N-acetyltransferase
MTAEPHITPATRDDVIDLAALLRASGLPVDGVDRSLGTAVVARDHGRVVGSAVLELYAPDALLRSVAVAAAQRGRGLGTRLVEAAIAMALDRGVGTVYLLTETAPAFFARLGFEPVPRAEVAEPVTRSAEFKLLCGETAQAMRRILAADRDPRRR